MTVSKHMPSGYNGEISFYLELFYLLVRDVFIDITHKNIFGKKDLAICNSGASTLTGNPSLGAYCQRQLEKHHTKGLPVKVKIERVFLTTLFAEG